MKTAIVLCVLSVVAVGLARPEEKYTDKYDSTNVQEILDNPKIFENYYNCIMDLGKCTPDGKELKTHIPDALENGCKPCTEKQRENVKFVSKYMINEKPDLWKKLAAKYDPENKYATKYEDEIKKLNA